MANDNENSLGDQNTFDGGDGQFDPQSLGDEMTFGGGANDTDDSFDDGMEVVDLEARYKICLLYTSPSPRDLSTSRMPSSA